MTIGYKIKDEKLQYHINREAVEIPALSSGKIDKYEYLTGEEILPSDQSIIIEQTKFTYSWRSKAFEKQIKTIEDQGIKQVEPLKALKPDENWELKSVEGLFPKEMRTSEIENEIDEIKKLENKIKRKNLKYETNKYMYDFQQSEMIRSFGDSIYAGKISIDEMDQSNHLENMIEFNDKTRPKKKKRRKEEKKKKKVFDSIGALYEGWELTVDAFKSRVFPIKSTKGKRLKILTLKQMLQRLSIALA